MSLRARIFIIVSLLVFLVLGISIFLVVRNRNTKTQTPQTGNPQNTSSQNNNQSNNQILVNGQVPEGLPVKAASSLEAQKNAVEQLAKVFVERYGTYSTDNNFQNIKDVSTLVTPALWNKISASLSPKSSTGTSGSFVGVTTKVVSAGLTSWSDAKASVDLKTARTEEKNGVVTNRYQNISVDLVKVDTVWLVEKFIWQ